MKLIRTKGRGAAQTAQTLAALERRGGASLDSVLPAVRRIVTDVRRRGDRVMLRYASEFDGLAGADDMRVTPREMAAAWKGLDPALREALETAAKQIRNFARRQMPSTWSMSPVRGLKTGQLVRPLGSVGCYVPSGRHPLPSTLLMTAIPAQVAGVKRIVVVSPKPAPETLAAAHLLGIKEFYRLGGAHAVAALAYGTETVARVDKIVGPGNLYVTAAKRLVSFDCAIDMLAGPTEIVVTSDRGPAAGIAADLVAQAEHDPEALTAVAVDGKTVKGSRQKDGRPVHLMSAVAHTTQRLLNQIPVAEKSNEIPAFRPLLEALPLRNVVITADAEQCQRANAQFVVYQKEGDYIFLAKGNQPSLEALAQTKLSGAFPPGSPNQR